jgi:hypothetical protein
MSNSEDKIKHSKRMLKDDNAVKKQLKIVKQHNIPGYNNTSIDEKEPHRLAKKHAMDCGNPHCFLCGNPRKTHKDKLTQQEKRLFQDIDTPNHRHNNGSKNDPDE